MLRLDGSTEVKFEIRVYTIREIVQLRNTGKIDSNLAFQRGDAAKWNKLDHLELFVDSIQNGYSIGVLHASLTKDGVLQLIDGKQRERSFKKCIMPDNITGDFLPVFDGRVFDDLSQEEQDKFLNYPVTVYVFPEISEIEKRIMFKRLNSGVALTSKEVNRDAFLRIYELPEFKNLANKIYSLLPLVAGNTQDKSNAESILLNAICTVLDNFNGTTTSELLAQVKTMPLSKFQEVIKTIDENFQVFSKLYNQAYNTGDKKVKNYHAWIFKSVAHYASFLASLSVPNMSKELITRYFDNFLDFTYDSKVHSSRGDDQEDIASSVKAGSGGKDACIKRVKIFSKIAIGDFTKNTSKIKESVTTTKKNTVPNSSTAENIDKILESCLSDWKYKRDDDSEVPVSTIRRAITNILLSVGDTLIPHLENNQRRILRYNAYSTKQTHILGYTEFLKYADK